MNDFYLGKIAATDSEGSTIVFDGETDATIKKYKRLSSYLPVANDRVLILKTQNTYIIIGKIE